MRVVSHEGGLSSGWSLIRVVSHQGGLSSGWPLIRVVSRQGGLSSGWSLKRLITVSDFRFIVTRRLVCLAKCFVFLRFV